MASNILRRSNFIKVLEEAFGNEQWRQCNLFGVKQGGFGTVFAIQFNGTNYCLKVQNEPINERGAQEFQLEANISRSLNICSTCKVIRSFNPQSNGLAWILYEYIPGCTLYDLINKTHLHSIPNYDLFLMKALI
ncbi:hypothetical protein TVAG_464110 [Trichomonas vaginalis G3]|uniref:Protein kinase domain-containing protein n=1 Tax=Trichomonas vaginalis (strain ATCC PRA-98 / G3) TaxID=412133 RepID=A2E263_TRIV3|nr:hypothetical protein TVAG_464110 [Trichomonas vaginalis G3]|eukprot:XP_001325500.1 hypothetical protein [Trichomonas vaginalis G3]